MEREEIYRITNSGKIIPIGELVRCKYCKHHRKGTCSAAAGIAVPPPDDWFCADGKRKEDR